MARRGSTTMSLSLPVVEIHGRVLRGGGFYDHPSFLRSAARLNNRPYQVDDYFGMRVARTIR